MLKQVVHIKKYDWHLEIYYHVTCYEIDTIIAKLKEHDCKEEFIKDAYDNMKDCKLNTGITYSNNKEKYSLIVISDTSEPSQFLNSLFHEIYHLISHIVEYYNINYIGEEAAYLAGTIAQLIYPKSKKFLCKCCQD